MQNQERAEQDIMEWKLEQQRQQQDRQKEQKKVSQMIDSDTYIMYIPRSLGS